MPAYTPYRDDIETIEPDERETHAKIIEVMTDGMKNTREKYGTSPLGGINRARLLVDNTMAALRRNTNGRPSTEPASIDVVPA